MRDDGQNIQSSSSENSVKKPSLFRFVLTDMRFSSKDRLEFIGFFVGCFIIFFFLIQWLINYLQYKGPDFGLGDYFMVIFGIYALQKYGLRFNRKFIFPYMELTGKKEDALIKEMALKATLNATKPRFNIRDYKIELLIFSLLPIGAILSLFVPGIGQYSIFKGFTVVAFLGFILMVPWVFIKSHRKSSKELDKLYDNVEKISPEYAEQGRKVSKVTSTAYYIFVILFTIIFILAVLFWDRLGLE